MPLYRTMAVAVTDGLRPEELGSAESSGSMARQRRSVAQGNNNKKDEKMSSTAFPKKGGKIALPGSMNAAVAPSPSSSPESSIFAVGEAEHRRLPPSIKKDSKKKKQKALQKVRFSPRMRVRLCRHLSDYDPSDLESTWYSSPAWDESNMRDILINVRLHRERNARRAIKGSRQHPLDDGREVSVRGLEHMLSSAEGQKRRERRREAVQAALREQRQILLEERSGNSEEEKEATTRSTQSQFQSHQSHQPIRSPEERIARAYRSVSGAIRSIEEARRRGAQDEADVRQADKLSDDFLSGALERALSLGVEDDGPLSSGGSKAGVGLGGPGSSRGGRRLRRHTNSSTRQRARGVGDDFIGATVVLS